MFRRKFNARDIIEALDKITSDAKDEDGGGDVMSMMKVKFLLKTVIKMPLKQTSTQEL
jgi:hypothetical protein